MIWLNPLAWLGLLGVAVPVAIHLLARGHARVQRFPTLRFLDASRLLPTRRTRLQDVLLLATRCAVIVLAVAALARPLIVTAGRRQALDRGLARAIIVDTSASMRRTATSGGLAVDMAREEARRVAAESQASIVIESTDPARALGAGSAWLAREARRRELVVISDFQRDQFDASDFAAIPGGIGVSPRRIPINGGSIVETRGMSGLGRLDVRTTRVNDRTDAEWTATGSRATNRAIVFIGSDADRNALNAPEAALATVAVPMPIGTTRSVAIRFTVAGDAAASTSQSYVPPYVPWMVDLLASLQVDALPVVRSEVGVIEGRQRLILVTDSLPESLASVRMAVTALRATSVAPHPRELEPRIIPDTAIGGWRRPVPEDVPSQLRQMDGPSDGRWLWLAALILLGVEVPLRKRPQAAAAPNAEERARAA